jgi:mannonate dehydratase
VALDLVCYNFGIQEYSPFNDRLQEVFRGCPVMKNGYLYANDAPGWGIEVDEKLAARYPYGSFEQGDRQRLNGGWGEVRRRDGTVIKQ